MVKYCSVLMGNLWSVEDMLGISSSISSSVGSSNEELVMVVVLAW